MIFINNAPAHTPPQPTEVHATPAPDGTTLDDAEAWVIDTYADGSQLTLVFEPQQQGTRGASPLANGYEAEVPFLSEAPAPRYDAEGRMLPLSEQTDLYAFATTIFEDGFPDAEVNRGRLVGALMTLARVQDERYGGRPLTTREFFAHVALGEFMTALDGEGLSLAVEALVRRFEGIGAFDNRTTFFRFVAAIHSWYAVAGTRVPGTEPQLEQALELLDTVTANVLRAGSGHQPGRPYNWYNPNPTDQPEELQRLVNQYLGLPGPRWGTDVGQAYQESEPIDLVYVQFFENPACPRDEEGAMIWNRETGRCTPERSGLFGDYAFYPLVITDGLYRPTRWD